MHSTALRPWSKAAGRNIEIRSGALAGHLRPAIPEFNSGAVIAAPTC